MPFCGECGAENAATNHFCDNCGHQLLEFNTGQGEVKPVSVAERVLGRVPSAREGTNNFFLFLTDTRIVAAKTGTVGKEFITGAGFYSMATRNYLKRRERNKSRDMADLSPSELLQLDKSNYDISYQAIDTARLNGRHLELTLNDGQRRDYSLRAKRSDEVLYKVLNPILGQRLVAGRH